ncbi:cell division protein ZipA [Dongshaea marina]|uniref:cell division protein ZipA n=1 Tax=Dongshaea marina TaxID=2047966 RepID=UPI000D3E45F2|nr:cell division protein ZipA [Dongshaea marina]
MQDLRIVLIIVGIVVIVAIMAHGLWKSKKGKYRPLKEKPLRKMPETRPESGSEPALDSEPQFDADGIGEVRVVGRDQPEAEPGLRKEPQLGPVTAPQGELAKEVTPPAMEVETKLSEPVVATEPALQVADEEESQAEPEAVTQAQVETRPSGEEPAPSVKSWQDIYVINVMALDNRELEGAKLLPSLTRLGFKYGEMEIFHRHEDSAGKGQVLFSLANMVNPGTFRPEKMEQFSTPGISLFMQLPRQGYGERVYKLMSSAADRLAGELGGVLMDAQRQPLSEEQLDENLDGLRAYDSQKVG